MKKLKDNIFIEGFATQTGVDLELLSDEKQFLRCDILGEFNSNLLYEGKTSDIPEEVAKECAEYYIQRCKFKNYNPKKLIEGIRLNGFNYAKQSILSACDKPYCIIYRIL